jgi:hypothetical protein
VRALHRAGAATRSLINHEDGAFQAFGAGNAAITKSNDTVTVLIVEVAHRREA